MTLRRAALLRLQPGDLVMVEADGDFSVQPVRRIMSHRVVLASGERVDVMSGLLEGGRGRVHSVDDPTAREWFARTQLHLACQEFAPLAEQAVNTAFRLGEVASRARSAALQVCKVTAAPGLPPRSAAPLRVGDRVLVIPHDLVDVHQDEVVDADDGLVELGSGLLVWSASGEPVGDEPVRVVADDRQARARLRQMGRVRELAQGIAAPAGELTQEQWLRQLSALALELFEQASIAAELAG